MTSQTFRVELNGRLAHPLGHRIAIEVRQYEQVLRGGGPAPARPIAKGHGPLACGSRRQKPVNHERRVVLHPRRACVVLAEHIAGQQRVFEKILAAVPGISVIFQRTAIGRHYGKYLGKELIGVRSPVLGARVRIGQRSRRERQPTVVGVGVVLEILVAPPDALSLNRVVEVLGLIAKKSCYPAALRIGQFRVEPVIADGDAEQEMARHQERQAFLGSPLRFVGEFQQLFARQFQRVAVAGHEPGKRELGDQVALITRVLHRYLSASGALHAREVL